ncbi:Uncharacterised protein [uncultured archaeon]|nr:Uncharacterised protein [uncultured archaeon]
MSDNDLGNVGVDGETIVFTGTTGTTSIPPPAATNPVTFSDVQGMTISTIGGANVLNVHANTLIQTPSNPPAASLSLKNVGTGTLTIEVSFSGGGSPNPYTITSTVSGGDVSIPLIASGGITQIKITQFPGSDTGGTIAVSELVIQNKDLVTVQDIQFNPGSPGTLLTISSGAYSSSATLGTVSSSNLLQAGFAGDDSYNASPSASVTYAIGAVPTSANGLGDTATVLGDTNKGFIQSTTCPDGTTNAGPNGDYICAAWKSTGIPIGAPVNGVQYYYKLSSPHSNAPDIYVEADYMQGHRPDQGAISDVVNKFQQHGIYLHVQTSDDDVLPHVAAINVWKDSDQDPTNDFDSIKNAHFGNSTEHPVLTMTGTPTISTPAAVSPFTTTITASGIQITTPTSPQTNGYTNGKIVLNLDMTLGTTATPTIGAVSIAGASLPSGFTLGTPTQAVATKSGVVNGWVVTITIPFTATSAMGPVNIGTISAAETFSASPGTITFGRSAGSPSMFTDLLNAKAQVYHYFIWVHSVGPCGPSGVSEMPGNDGIIALGCNFDPSALEFPGTASIDASGKLETVGTRNEQAGSFMHELGHQLGLNHGGPQKESGVSVPDSPINCKPNYASVMSYTRQMPNYLGIKWILDYSSGTLGALDETKLQEFQKLTASSPAPTIVWNTLKADASGKTYRIDAANDPAGLDWDGSGTITASPNTVSVDVNNFGVTGCAASLPETIASYPYKDHNDWANLNYNLRTGLSNSFDGVAAGGGTTLHTPSPAEPTADEVKTATLLSSVYKGNNPPPNQDGTSDFNMGQTIPLKFALYKSDGVTLITYSTIGHAEYTTDGKTFTRITPDFALDSTGTFYQLNWQTNKNQFSVGQYVGIDIVIDLPNNQGGATTKILFDPAHPLSVPGTTVPVTQLIQFIK